MDAIEQEKLEYKKRFAALLYEGQRPMVATTNLFVPAGYTDTAFLLTITNEWPFDSDVLEELTRLRNRIPTDNELLADMLQRAKTASDDDYAKIMKIVFEARGLIGKSKVPADAEKNHDRLMELAAMVLGDDAIKPIDKTNDGWGTSL
jgi:hypothetical protein